VTTRNNGKKRILCVDDDPDCCELIAVLLRGYEVVTAYSKHEAVRQATGESFDLYLLDYYLPDGTGLELCHFIRAFDKETPIIFCTSSDDITQRHAVTAGAQQLLKKGYVLVENLEETVSRFLQLAA